MITNLEKAELHMLQTCYNAIAIGRQMQLVGSIDSWFVGCFGGSFVGLLDGELVGFEAGKLDICSVGYFWQAI